MENTGSPTQSETQPIEGHIVLDRVRDTRPIRSFITKRLVRWLQSHGIGPGDRLTYNVALNKSSYGHVFTCRIELHTEGSHWEALVTERDLHQAILSALNHLSPQRQRRNAYALQPA